MAYREKRGGTGERVLESRHVIGLFMLMLLFSGVFFTLGYMMGRDQYGGQVRAATDFFRKPDVSPKPDANSKRASNSAPSTTPTDSAPPPNSDWEFYHAGDSRKTEDHLKPVAPAPTTAQKNAPVLVRSAAPPRTSSPASKAPNVPLIPGGSYILQVAALRKEAVALELAKGLQKKNFPAFVVSPQGDKYYRVQVGPYADQKSAEAARKSLEGAGFKAIVKH
jgi:cell division septation protein DedD